MPGLSSEIKKCLKELGKNIYSASGTTFHWGYKVQIYFNIKNLHRTLAKNNFKKEA